MIRAWLRYRALRRDWVWINNEAAWGHVERGSLIRQYGDTFVLIRNGATIPPMLSSFREAVELEARGK